MLKASETKPADHRAPTDESLRRRRIAKLGIAGAVLLAMACAGAFYLLRPRPETNLRQIALAIQNYRDTYDGRFPSAEVRRGTGGRTVGGCRSEEGAGKTMTLSAG